MAYQGEMTGVHKEGDGGLFAGPGENYAWLWESGMEVCQNT